MISIYRLFEDADDKYADAKKKNVGIPPALKSNDINIKNHMTTIKNYGLGPIDPRQSNDKFWNDKATKWKISSGDARGRLCMNCEHYLSTSKIIDYIDNGPAVNFKTSSLPTPETIVDIESKPVAYCSLYDITCSPTRTCDSQEMGGPIDDFKSDAIKFSAAVQKNLETDEVDKYL